MPTISIIIATQGRPTLRRAVESILPQLSEGDEILCVGDNYCPDEPGCVNIADLSPLPSQYGNRQRNTATPLASGSILCFLDDDDWHAPDSLETIRNRVRALPVMFRQVRPSGRVVWRRPLVRRENIGTGNLCLPNVPENIPQWPVESSPPDGISPRATDFDFILECVRRFGGVEFDERITYHCGPRS